MTDPKHNDSHSKEETKKDDFMSSCCDFEQMSQMMRKYCGGGKNSFDCGEMMKKMWRGFSEKETSTENSSNKTGTL